MERKAELIAEILDSLFVFQYRNNPGKPQIPRGMQGRILAQLPNTLQGSSNSDLNINLPLPPGLFPA
jgi:hypothetical protein